jgi:aspartyl protease family protein
MKLHQTALSIIISVISAFSSQALAANSALAEIQVVGLFKDAAIINLHDRNQMMRVGDTKADVRLLAANSDSALIEYHGKRMQLSMAQSSAIRVGLPAPTSAQAQLMSSGDMYNVTGSINDQLADFVVDTGASYITMSVAQAARLRLDYNTAQKITMSTANGKVEAQLFKLQKIRIGGIELHNVQAAVVDNLASPRILLGMSFLNQVEMQHKSGLMILTQRN